jgi:type II secretory ATPase GspE/PulE/Tfp pilus assembly ATPase PilB-like protein
MHGRLRSYGIEQKLKSFTSAGCDVCAGRGYKGRTALFELLVPDTDLRELVMSDPHHDALNAWVKQSGMKMLRADGLEKVQQGLISLEDLLRVLF